MTNSISTERAPNASTALMWFRRDLRDYDNAALSRALAENGHVHCVFVFDTVILGRLPAASHRRVEFLLESVSALREALRSKGGDLIILHGSARDEVPRLSFQLGVSAVYANRDYEPAAVERDSAVRESLGQCGIAFKTFKDIVVFERDELLTQTGASYSMFTPYKNAWLRKVSRAELAAHEVESHRSRLAKPRSDHAAPTLQKLGFLPSNLKALKIRPGMTGSAALIEDFKTRIDQYDTDRDFPSLRGVSYLSVHNRFGTCSIRELARLAIRLDSAGSKTWLSELIWRDFYFQILWHHPRVANTAFKPMYEDIRWENDEDRFRAWCEGRTGYPIVDAAMRQLNQTGYMHNRLRMIVASFLTKDLLIDWRWGERYFANLLNDYDLAANNGGWQWAASTGCDAQPYFRIFNPVRQSERFDPKGAFIRRYLPELRLVPDKFIHAPWTLAQSERTLAAKDYPLPIVDHAQQGTKAVQLFKAVRNP